MNQLNRFCLILGPLWAVQLAGPVCADPQSPDDSMRVRAVSTIRSVGSRTGAPRSGGVNFRDQDAALPSSLSRGSVGQTPPDRARDPNEPLPLVRFTPVQTPDRSAPVRASGAASIPMGNHKEAHAGAASCLGLYTMYAARSQGLDGLSGTRVYLKLLAPESAELEREQKGDAGTYRKSVQVAYLLVWVPAADWIQADSAARKRLTTLPLRHLRSLYPQASLFVSVFDGETPLAHANWKSTQKVPRVELL